MLVTLFNVVQENCKIFMFCFFLFLKKGGRRLLVQLKKKNPVTIARQPTNRWYHQHSPKPPSKENILTHFNEYIFAYVTDVLFLWIQDKENG